MATGSCNEVAVAQELSALVDGELNEGALAAVCAHWRSDASSRATWHVYQLIGDVLRSEDLASDAARDAAFLDALRARMASEPVILAPQVDARPAVASGFARRSWIAPSAIAAGFVAVAGVLVIMRGPASLKDELPGASVAGVSIQNAAPVGVTTLVPSALPSIENRSFVANGKFIRDAGLDRYLAAHKHFAGSAALGVPSTFLRGATLDAPGR